jgi:multicomponent Na+:H+ antiporter subunit A
MPASLILDTVTRAVFHTIWVLSLYLLFAGHNAPGGGFVGGLVGGAALVLRYAGAGSDGVRQAVRLRPEALLGGGLLLAGATGLAPWLAGREFLSSASLDIAVPIVGEVHATSALPFDIGVYLVVVGLVLGALVTLGAEEEQEEA